MPTSTPLGLKYRIAVISDNDDDSKIETEDYQWASFLKLGDLTWDDKSEAITIDWDPEPNELKSRLSRKGRGMELSELVTFNGQLYTVGDKTGVVYRIEKDGQYKLVPWVILPDGNGHETKGFKGEWMTVKDEHLYVGSVGTERTNRVGTQVMHTNNMFVKRISVEGEVEHLDWKANYVALRSKAGIEFPGYVRHEAVLWSNVHQEWTFLPRKVSKERYNGQANELRGSNLMFEANANFTNFDLKTVGDIQPSHGFSSMKFVPDTQDSVIVALKSKELQGVMASYVMVFHRNGTILFPETKIGDRKYEGIEFI